MSEFIRTDNSGAPAANCHRFAGWIIIGVAGLMMIGCQSTEHRHRQPSTNPSLAHVAGDGGATSVGYARVTVAAARCSASPRPSVCLGESRVEEANFRVPFKPQTESVDPSFRDGHRASESLDYVVETGVSMGPRPQLTLQDSIDRDCDVICWRSTPKRDFERFCPMIGSDAKAIFNHSNGAWFLAALGGSLIVRDKWDDRVRHHVADHPDRWGKAGSALRVTGEFQYQVPVLTGFYLWTLHSEDRELHDFSRALFSAYTINGLSTLAVKGVVNSERPSDEWNGGEFGFPSFHTSSSFAIAAVIDEYYGCRAGLPAYLLAGCIGWSRIDERDHDLSDVVFGAAMGYLIGKGVAGNHLRGDGRARLLPYAHPTEGVGGMQLQWDF